MSMANQTKEQAGEVGSRVEVAEVKLLELNKKIGKLEELTDNLNKFSRNKISDLSKDLTKTQRAVEDSSRDLE
jgi:hypothetical protein